jgi:WD40 repeat protein
MRGDVPHFSPAFEHFVGPDFAPVRVWDGYIESGARAFPSVDACCASALSADGALLLVCSRVGVAAVLCCAAGAPREVARVVLPSFAVRVAAISSHFGLVCGATGDSLLIVDLCSGLTARRAPFAHAAVALAFDEANGFVVAAAARAIVVFALDLRTVAEIELRAQCATITALSCQPATVWLTSPLFATGHADGTARVWQLDTGGWAFREVAYFGGPRQPLAAVHLFARCQALMMIEARSGAAHVASVDNIGARFLRAGMFAACAVCEAALRPGGAVQCVRCGLALCKGCVAAKRPVRCATCVQADGEVTATALAAEEEEVDERVAVALGAVTPHRSGGVDLGSEEPRDSGAVDLQYRETDVEWIQEPPSRQTL